jgi:hypothetical protein
MKGYRIILILVAIALIATLGGCSKTWSINFALVSNLDDWILTDEYELLPQGLLLTHDNCVTAPFTWIGDFTITVNFELAVDDIDTAYGSIWVGSTPLWQPEDLISFYFYSGGPNSGYQLWTDGALHDWEFISYSTTEIPGIKNDSINSYVLQKAGNHFIAKLNGTLLSEWDNVIYDSDIFYLTLNSFNLTNAQIIYKSAKVKYEEGNMTPVI